MLLQHSLSLSVILNFLYFLAVFTENCDCDLENGHIFDKYDSEPPEDIEAIPDVLTFTPDAKQDLLGRVEQDNIIQSQRSMIHYQSRSVNVNKNNLFLLPFKNLQTRSKRQVKGGVGKSPQPQQGSSQPDPYYFQTGDSYNRASSNGIGYGPNSLSYSHIPNESPPGTKSSLPLPYHEKARDQWQKSKNPNPQFISNNGFSTETKYPYSQASNSHYTNQNAAPNLARPNLIYSQNSQTPFVSKSSHSMDHNNKSIYPNQRYNSSNAAHYLTSQNQTKYQFQVKKPYNPALYPYSIYNSEVPNGRNDPNTYNNGQPRVNNYSPPLYTSSTPSTFYQVPPSRNQSRNVKSGFPQYFVSSTPSAFYQGPPIKSHTTPLYRNLNDGSRSHQSPQSGSPFQNNYPQSDRQVNNDRNGQHPLYQQYQPNPYPTFDYRKYNPSPLYQYPDQRVM